MEMEEREERKKMQELREQEKREDEERERLLEQKQVSRWLFPPCLLHKKTRVGIMWSWISWLLKKILQKYLLIWNDVLKCLNAFTNV